MSEVGNTVGVYSITAPSGEVYYGKSVNIPRRWQEHKRDLSKLRHANESLQWLWVFHHGNLKFDVVEYLLEDECGYAERALVDNGGELCINEVSPSRTRTGSAWRKKISDGLQRHFADPLNAEKHREYMATPEYKEACASAAKNRSQESKVAASMKMKEYFSDPLKREEHREKSKHRRVPIRCLETGVVYESRNSAARVVGGSAGALSTACVTGGICYGYHWESIKI